jgi:iron complex transport system substrate-binding protein
VLLRDYTGGQPDGIWPWAQPLLGEAHPETFTEEMPFEKIAAAQPDLIISVNGGLDQAAYERLSEIAPTIPHQAGTDEWTGTNGNWEDRLRWYGEIFGQEAKAQQQIDEINARLDEIKAAHPEWAGMEAVSVTEWDAFYVDVDHPRGQLLESFGFVIPEEFRTENQVAYEDILKLDRAILLWVNGADDPSPVLDNKLRDTLTAHAEGREIYVDKYLTQALTNQSPAAWGYVLDTLPALLAAAADGDPSTPVSTSVEAGVAP